MATDPAFKAQCEAERQKRKQAYAAKLDELCTREPRFPREAYELVFESLSLAVADSATIPKGPKHVTAAELVRACVEYARETWSNEAKAHLSSLGLNTSSDFGEAVFQLVKNGFLGKQPDENLGDFNHLPFLDD